MPEPSLSAPNRSADEPLKTVDLKTASESRHVPAYCPRSQALHGTRSRTASFSRCRATGRSTKDQTSSIASRRSSRLGLVVGTLF